MSAGTSTPSNWWTKWSRRGSLRFQIKSIVLDMAKTSVLSAKLRARCESSEARRHQTRSSDDGNLQPSKYCNSAMLCFDIFVSQSISRKKGFERAHVACVHGAWAIQARKGQSICCSLFTGVLGFYVTFPPLFQTQVKCYGVFYDTCFVRLGRSAARAACEHFCGFVRLPSYGRTAASLHWHVSK